MFTNGSYQLTRYFPIEIEWLVPRILIYTNVYGLNFCSKKCDWVDHIQKLELTIDEIIESRLKCDIDESFFGKTKMEYLGFWVKINVVRSPNKN